MPSNSDSEEDEGKFDMQKGDAGGGSQETYMGPVYNMWESALEKLKLLNYEREYCAPKHASPFSRIEFVYPGANASHQFTDFVEIAEWLCEMIGGRSLFTKEAYDDPNTVANKLMLALRSLDFRSNFPAQKLKAGHGDPVCSVLDFLTQKALETRSFKWNRPIYEDADDVEHGGEDVDEDEDAIDEENDGGVDDDALFQEPAGDDIDEVSMDQSAHQILHAEVDPVAWKTELERVAPRLKANQTLSSNEWRAHVDQTCSSREAIDKVLDDTSGDLRALNKDVSEELNKLSTKEKYINHQFTGVSADYRDVKAKLEELEKKSSVSNESVTKLTNELTELTERMDDLKESFESKDSGIHDTSPLVRMKAALQQIKQESQAFDLRIGVVSHSLLAARVATSTRRRMGAHARRRNKKHRHKHGSHEAAGAYSDEDVG